MTNEELRQAIDSIDMKGWKVYQLEQPDKSCYCHIAGCTVDEGQPMPKKGWAITQDKTTSVYCIPPDYWRTNSQYIKYRDTEPENGTFWGRYLDDDKEYYINDSDVILWKPVERTITEELVGLMQNICGVGK